MRRVSIVVVLVLVFGYSTQSQTYQVVILSPSAGFNETRGSGIYAMQRVGAARIAGAEQPEYSHAILWLGDSLAPIDLNPAGFDYSRANDTDGTRQVGSAYHPNVPYTISRVAALWSGSAGSFVPLCAYPFCGRSASEAYAVAGDQQVGFTDDSFTCSECGQTIIMHAALWRGSPESHIDLHPLGIGCDRSFAFDTDGIQQVGYGTFPASDRKYHSLLWSGTAQSVVDLSPVAFQVSFANAVRNGVQVGYGQNYDQGSLTLPTALVWHGTAASAVSLGQGVIEDTNGSTHVGTRADGFANHAFRWDGEIGAGFDLHSLLPAGAYVNSGAEQIDAAGNIIGWAQRADTYYLEGIVWRVASIVPNSMPNVSLINPRPYSTFRMNTFIEMNAQASDSDGSIASVEFIADGEVIGSGIPDGPIKSGETASFQMAWKVSRAGTYRVQVRATDNLGAVSYSRPSIIFVKSGIGF
jgi:hypothetical protein